MNEVRVVVGSHFHGFRRFLDLAHEHEPYSQTNGIGELCIRNEKGVLEPCNHNGYVWFIFRRHHLSHCLLSE
jgi:hypothetical protein